jgi:hypothetical protein
VSDDVLATTNQGNIILHGFTSMAPVFSVVNFLSSGGRPHASISLVPKIADRYGIIQILSGVPSYIIRVWPEGRGHHDVHRIPIFDTGS